jgi:transcriptional regulator with XRE-family HTH domain
VDLHPGEILKLCRIRKKISQERLAIMINEMAAPKQLTYQMQISRIESGIEVPDPHLKEAIERVLGQEVWPKTLDR